jgi:hypothetical protein
MINDSRNCPKFLTQATRCPETAVNYVLNSDTFGRAPELLPCRALPRVLVRFDSNVVTATGVLVLRVKRFAPVPAPQMPA